MPRFRRGIDRNSWVPIGDSSASTTARNGTVSTSARLDGPPNFGDPIEPQLSPPPSYAQVRNLSRPEIASLIVRRGPYNGAASTLSNATPRRSPAPAMSSKVTTLDDIRHTERHIQGENRLSSVPNYPVFLDAPDNPRRRRSRRRSSIASTNTAGIFMSMGQLPGSEPFDGRLTPSDTASEEREALESRLPLSPSIMSPFEASVAQVMTVHRVSSWILGPGNLRRFKKCLKTAREPSSILIQLSLVIY
jgi:hypothetical protein